MIHPSEWTLPDPRAVIAAMDPHSKRGRRANWGFTHQISAVDLYSYLKHRFGEANGFAMTLREPSVDNFIHWNYTIASGPVILDVRGLDLRTEITAFLPLDTDAPDWPVVRSKIVSYGYASPSGMGPSTSSALLERHVMNGKTTKKARGPRGRRRPAEGLEREYRFDYAKSRANRFARQMAHDAVVVVLDSDVAKVFRDPKRVNSLLRATIAALETKRPRRTG